MTQKLPEGFEDRSSDIVGVWAMETDNEYPPIQFIPSHAIVGDGKKFDKTKPSLLIFGKLTAETKLIRKGDEDDDERELFTGKPGDLVGVWGKPGMKDIAVLCGVEVFMQRTPAKDKDIGKGNDLKAFLVASKELPNRPIPITVDRRIQSKGVRCILDPQDYVKKPDAPSTDRIPF